MKPVFSVDQRCRPENGGTFLSDITHKIHALTKEKRVQCCLVISWVCPSHKKKIVFITLGSQASFWHIAVTVTMTSVHIFLEAQSIN